MYYEARSLSPFAGAGAQFNKATVNKRNDGVIKIDIFEEIHL
jgi:hypothetical protein